MLELCVLEGRLNTFARDDDPLDIITQWVRQEWQRIALATTSMWYKVSLNLLKFEGYNPDNDVQIQVRIAHLYLSRTGLPLSQRLYHRDARSADMNKPALQLMKTYQFTDLLLCHLYPQQFLSLWMLPGRSWSKLRELNLQCNGIYADKKTRPFFHSKVHFPRLRALTMSGPWNSRHLETAVPLRKLRYLRADMEMLVSTAFSILKQATSLQYCKMRILDTTADGTASNKAVKNLVLPHLHTLELEIDSGVADGKKLIDALITPKLMELLLYFSGDSQISGRDTKMYVNLVKRSGMRHLRELKIYDPTGANLHVRSLLKSMPELQSLQLGATSDLDGDTLNDISIGRLGPKLQNFELVVELEPDQLLQMIELRQQRLPE
ncbi:hypothetical protein AX17_002817 [Amanita inopinata Kibby_2008]|nr:hypothetical protein AX17_002817 [Amanita inopinata Kibby_2008]